MSKNLTVIDEIDEILDMLDNGELEDYTDEPIYLGICLEDTIEDNQALNPYEETAKHNQAEELQKVLETLNPKEREVLKLRFGLDGNGIRTFTEIGQMFNLLRTSIQQIEAKALRKLRHPSKITQLEGLLEAA